MTTSSHVVRDRLDKVISGNDSGGITHEVNWIGGGHYDVIAAARLDEASGPPDSDADEHVRIQVVTYRKDGSVVPAFLDLIERAEEALRFVEDDLETPGIESEP